MSRKSLLITLLLVCVATTTTAQTQSIKATTMTPSQNKKFTLMTLDPGHCHAALVQKEMNDQVSPDVYVYAPAGFDLDEHMKRINDYNNRAANPTRWQEKVYTGGDYLQKMLADKPGNVVVLAGNNRRKMEYVTASINAGINVLSDKPMCLDEKDYEALRQALAMAEKKGVMLYDIMTERYEITTMLQKALSENTALFGVLQKGTPDDPAVTKESIHHLFKYVSGKPLQRPGWFFDTAQQGEGIVDVTTHLVDLIFWEAFPEQAMALKDLAVLKARRWSTPVSREQFTKVTGLKSFPDYLHGKIDAGGSLPLYSNGEFTLRAKGVHTKVSVIWNFQAPEGTGDTHYSVMKGTKALVEIRQGKEEKFIPELYVKPAAGSDTQMQEALLAAVRQLRGRWPGIGLTAAKGGGWQVTIPDKYRDGHEAHFSQVAAKYLRFLSENKMPAWETPNMIAKYYVTTQALKLAMAAGQQASK
ncbi:MAG: putative oxidoreductase C-terminal domain-containing protein [Blastocatellia bacterium]